MINLIIGLFVAALAAAFFGFGGMATEFAYIARALFFIFVALLVVSAILSLFGAHAGAAGKAGRTFALIATVAAISIGTYAWIENDMSAERLGRVVDRQTVALVDTTGEALSDAGNRTQSFVTQTVADVRADSSKVANDVTDDNKADASKTDR